MTTKQIVQTSRRAQGMSPPPLVSRGLAVAEPGRPCRLRPRRGDGMHRRRASDAPRRRPCSRSSGSVGEKCDQSALRHRHRRAAPAESLDLEDARTQTAPDASSDRDDAPGRGSSPGRATVGVGMASRFRQTGSPARTRLASRTRATEPGRAASAFRHSARRRRVPGAAGRSWRLLRPPHPRSSRPG